jgi:hypothetical protein
MSDAVPARVLRRILPLRDSFAPIQPRSRFCPLQIVRLYTIGYRALLMTMESISSWGLERPQDPPRHADLDDLDCPRVLRRTGRREAELGGDEGRRERRADGNSEGKARVSVEAGG